MRSVGVDVGGTNIKVAVLEDDAIVATSEAPTDSVDGPDSVVSRIAGLVRDAGQVDAVGVAIPGLVDRDGRILLVPNLKGDWSGYQLARQLEGALGIGASVVNDGHAFALGEFRLGAGLGATSAMCIVCGTGIGGGLILHGQLYTGTNDRAGELGHQTMAEEGEPCPCGNRGCLELYAGSKAIARAAGRSTYQQVVEAGRRGDVAAARALAAAGRLIGRAIANVLIFVCPDRVIVGGGVAAAGSLFLDPLRGEVERRARVAPLESIAIVPAKLGPVAGAVGAAVYARS